jgi:uncharacterized ion transporter superfamily protein YfcC
LSSLTLTKSIVAVIWGAVVEGWFFKEAQAEIKRAQPSVASKE